MLKDWELHPLDEIAILAELLEQFKRGEIEPALCSLMLSWSSRLSAIYIAPNLSGPFQTVYLKNNK